MTLGLGENFKLETTALHWVPIPMFTHAHGLRVCMGAILLVMGGHGCAHVMLWVGIGHCWWVWFGYGSKFEGDVGLYWKHNLQECKLIWKPWAFRVAWGPFFVAVEKCTGQSRASAQDMVIWAKGWYAGEDDKTIKYFIRVGVLQVKFFLSEAFRLPKKLDLRRNLLLESVRHIDIHVQCSPPTDSWL